jgi:hypothetical protein
MNIYKSLSSEFVSYNFQCKYSFKAKHANIICGIYFSYIGLRWFQECWYFYLLLSTIQLNL